MYDHSLRLDWGDGPAPAEFHDALDQANASLEDRESLRPGAHWCMASRNGVPVARLAIYPQTDHNSPGMIGHYAAADRESGVGILDAAVNALRQRGSRRIVGPINGNTWSRYRLVLPPADHDVANEPAFLGEPVNPLEYASHFTAAGFTPVARYESRMTAPFAADAPRIQAAEEVAKQRGVAIASLNVDDFDATLDELHALSVRTFADNVFYSPIDRDMFVAMYRPMRAMLDPALVLLARDDSGSLIGYVFAYIDPLGKTDGRPYRVIVKTLAVDREWRSFGLGALLVHRVHTAARDRGLSTVVHALMHEANNSVRISASMQVFRRYALFEHTGRNVGA